MVTFLVSKQSSNKHCTIDEKFRRRQLFQQKNINSQSQLLCLSFLSLIKLGPTDGIVNEYKVLSETLLVSCRGKLIGLVCFAKVSYRFSLTFNQQTLAYKFKVLFNLIENVISQKEKSN